MNIKAQWKPFSDGEKSNNGHPNSFYIECSGNGRADVTMQDTLIGKHPGVKALSTLLQRTASEREEIPYDQLQDMFYSVARDVLTEKDLDTSHADLEAAPKGSRYEKATKQPMNVLEFFREPAIKAGLQWMLETRKHDIEHHPMTAYVQVESEHAGRYVHHDPVAHAYLDQLP